MGRLPLQYNGEAQHTDRELDFQELVLHDISANNSSAGLDLTAAAARNYHSVKRKVYECLRTMKDHPVWMNDR